jgi:hypothetical protein
MASKEILFFIGDVHLDASIVHSPSLSFVHYFSLGTKSTMASISMPQYHPHIILVVNLSLDIYIIIDNINNPNDLINDLIIKVC